MQHMELTTEMKECMIAMTQKIFCIFVFLPYNGKANTSTVKIQINLTLVEFYYLLGAFILIVKYRSVKKILQLPAVDLKNKIRQSKVSEPSLTYL